MPAPIQTTMTVTTMNDVLISNYGNESVTARELEINRGTLRKMIDDKRKNVVLINDDGSYTLLK